MKNLHVIPTDKPSRLCINGKNGQHIYITSDEEIKDGNYGVIGEVIMSYSQMFKMWNETQGKKVILTTDQDLINDGVQAIDDEFLNWFIDNPSCERVEVGYGWIRLTETDNEGYWVSIPDKQFEMQQEEPKQETLEEFIRTEANSVNESIGIIKGAKWQAERMYSEEDIRLAIKKARDISDGKDCFDVEDISGCTEVCTYGWKFNMSEDSIIEQFKKK